MSRAPFEQAQKLHPLKVKPRERVVHVRRRRFVLRGMAGEALLDWAELQVLAAREKAAALVALRRTDEDSLRQHLARLFQADDVLICSALQCDAELAQHLTDDEKRAVVAAQDDLNRMDLVAAGVDPGHLATEAGE